MPLDIVAGGGHQATVWRAALTPMLDWMTPQLAQEVQRIGIENAAHAREAAAAAKHHHKAAKTAETAETAKAKSPLT